MQGSVLSADPCHAKGASAHWSKLRCDSWSTASAGEGVPRLDHLRKGGERLRIRPDGGVVTQRTANPCTPVRFRLGPPPLPAFSAQTCPVPDMDVRMRTAYSITLNCQPRLAAIYMPPTTQHPCQLTGNGCECSLMFTVVTPISCPVLATRSSKLHSHRAPTHARPAFS